MWFQTETPVKLFLDVKYPSCMFINYTRTCQTHIALLTDSGLHQRPQRERRSSWSSDPLERKREKAVN